MDAATGMMIAGGTLVVAFVAVAFKPWNRFKGSVGGRFGKLSVDASNDALPGVRVEDAKSRKGAITALDQTGRGVNLKKIDVAGDIQATNTPPTEAPPKKS